MSTANAAVARRAAEIVQERGHCKGNFSDIDGRVCLWGALRQAATETSPAHLPYLDQLPFREHLKRMFPHDGSNWPGSTFNDRRDTTELDVAKVLLQLADRLELAP